MTTASALLLHPGHGLPSGHLHGYEPAAFFALALAALLLAVAILGDRS